MFRVSAKGIFVWCASVQFRASKRPTARDSAFHVQHLELVLSNSSYRSIVLETSLMALFENRWTHRSCR
jgi:hypothetical protein